MSYRRRKILVAGTALCLASAGSGAALATTAQSPSQTSQTSAAAGTGLNAGAWVATATRAYDTFGAHLLGPAPAGQSLNLVISLKPRNQAAEDAALRAMYTPGSATYHRFLTPAQFAAGYAPTSATLSAVTGYLTSHGFSNVDVLANHMVVTATATVGQATSAFRTAISDFRAGRLTFFANTAPVAVPARLGSAIQAVLGLNDVPLPTPHPATRTQAAHTQAGHTQAGHTQAGSPSISGIPPEDFGNTYDAAGTHSGYKTNVALFMEGAVGTTLSDLRLAESKNHLPVVPVHFMNVGPQSSDTSGQDEWDLDTQSSTGIAWAVRNLYIYKVGSLVDSQVDLAFARFVSDDLASAMSASIGGCDLFPYLDGSMISTDEVMQEGAMQGQSLFASSGDNGEGCAFLAATGVPSSFPGTNWPASGEFTTAVGGTSLFSDSTGHRIQEIGWIGSGGGTSETENPGWWTQASNPGFSAEFVSGGRAVPDVAMDADPNVATPALIYVGGKVTGVGGTSLSSPLMLGAWARLESSHSNALGFAPIDLYQVYDKVNPGTAVPGSPIPVIVPPVHPSAVPAFTDVTVGSNGLWPCLPGYDEVTGLGTPDIFQLSKAL